MAKNKQCRECRFYIPHEECKTSPGTCKNTGHTKGPYDKVCLKFIEMGDHMTKLDNFEFNMDLNGGAAKVITLQITCPDTSDAVMLMSDIIKQLYATNELLNKKGGPKVL